MNVCAFNPTWVDFRISKWCLRSFLPLFLFELTRRIQRVWILIAEFPMSPLRWGCSSKFSVRSCVVRDTCRDSRVVPGLILSSECSSPFSRNSQEIIDKIMDHIADDSPRDFRRFVHRDIKHGVVNQIYGIIFSPSSVESHINRPIDDLLKRQYDYHDPHLCG